MKIDSENHAYLSGPQGSWAAQGRWGMYFLSYLFLPDPVMPFIPTLLAVGGCVVSALFFVHSLSNKRGIADYLASPIAIACPVIYFAIYFTTLGYGLGVAFAVSCLGIYLLKHRSWLSSLFASVCFTFGIGIYQAVLPLIATLFCLQVISAILEEKNITFMSLLNRSFIFIVVLASASALSQTISMLVIHSMNITFDSNYIMGFVHYEKSASYFFNTLDKTANLAWSYYTGGKDYYLVDLKILKILFLLTLSVTVYRIITASCNLIVRLTGIIALVFAIAAPFAMHMLNAAYMPPRTVLGISFLLAGLVFFTVSASSTTLRLIAGALAICTLYNFSVANNRYAFSSQMTWLADRELSVQILERIHTAINKLPYKTDPYSQLPLEIVGWSEYFETPIFIHREVIGASFYTWGAGDVERIVRLFKTMGVSDYRAATRPERISIVEAAQQMPFWPYEGSVDVMNGIIVVKLREYNPNQFISMCQPPEDTNPVCLKYMPQ
jgi:hypothetical protein